MRKAGKATSRLEMQGLVARVTDAGFVVWIIVGVVVVTSGVQSSLFLTDRNVGNLFGQLVPLGLVTVGQTFAVLAGSIDLSVGATAKLSALLTAGLIDGQPGRVVPVILLVIAIGAAIGVGNGLLINRLRVSPFIVTLGTWSVLTGFALGYSVTPVGSIPSGMVDLAFTRVGPFPVPFLVFVGFATAAGWVLRATVFGRHIYAVGGDPKVARRGGIVEKGVMMRVMVVCSVFAALAGIMQATRAGVGVPTAGDGLELASITAVVVGGVSIFGGRGRLLGAIGGAFLLGLIGNSLNILGVSSVSTGLVRALVILAAIAIFTKKEQLWSVAA